MRIAVVAALPFPLPQGSQVFVGAQARALARADAEVTLFCYGCGEGEAPGDGVRIVRAPRALSAVPLRSGPSAGKPLADAALLATLLRAEARRGFDVAIAHHVEGALVAFAARALGGPRVVYVAHTLLGAELSGFGPRLAARALDRVGARTDRALARGADAVIALSAAGAAALAPSARGPLAVLPPGLDPVAAPSPAEIASACARHGLAPGGFALYAGNLDAYQALGELAAAARETPEIAFIAATHERVRTAPAPLRTLRVARPGEARTLAFGAGVLLLPRRHAGGFPIKLLNYMETGRPIVARAAVADGLVHGESAWLLSPEEGPAALAAATRSLLADPERATRLGVGARRILEARHRWPDLAARTLALCAPLARGR